MAEAKKPRRPRRNFAEERARVIQFCKLSIEILTLNGSIPDAAARIESFKQILKQMGESSE